MRGEIYGPTRLQAWPKSSSPAPAREPADGDAEEPKAKPKPKPKAVRKRPAKGASRD